MAHRASKEKMAKLRRMMLMPKDHIGHKVLKTSRQELTTLSTKCPWLSSKIKN